MVRFWGSVLAFKKLPFQHTSCLVRLFCEKTSKKHLRFIYKSCSWLTKLAFHLQTVHLILQTCISLTIVAIHFSNVASRFTIKHIIIAYQYANFNSIFTISDIISAIMFFITKNGILYIYVLYFQCLVEPPR